MNSAKRSHARLLNGQELRYSVMSRKALLLITVYFSLYTVQAQKTGTFTDTRDGKVYKTVTIGTQTWLAENFAYKPSSGNYWAYGDDQKNVAKYGYFYDLETAKKNVPAGWHVPTKEEWQTLIYSISLGTESIDTSTYVFKVIDPKKVYNDMIKGGKSGFNVLLAGLRDGGGFTDVEKAALFWCAVETHPLRENVGKSAVIELNSASGREDIFYRRITMGLSVRLVKD